MESIWTVFSGAAQTATLVEGERFAPLKVWASIRLVNASGDLPRPDSNLAITVARLGMLGPARSVQVRRTDSLNPQFRPFLADDFQATFVPLLVPDVMASMHDNGWSFPRKRASKHSSMLLSWDQLRVASRGLAGWRLGHRTQPGMFSSGSTSSG